MTYRDTARAFVRAENETRAGFTPTPGALASDRLPMSEWAESRRETMTPQTIAQNHALHVSDCAAELRELIEDTRPFSGWAMNSEDAAALATAARALLAAIGEDA